MEKPDVNKTCPVAEESQLNRNRSIKTKQLVRSQAIRESHSPPRTVSPYPASPASDKHNEDGKSAKRENKHLSAVPDDERKKEEKKQPVEIQVTDGSWDGGGGERRQRSRRWLGDRHHSEPSQALLSNGPRLACVCGACDCAQCRSQRRKHDCPVKQDSGIACSLDCPNCDLEHMNANGDGVRKAGSLEDQAFYCRCPDSNESSRNFPFTKSDSDPTEPSWPELVAFIKGVLNKSTRDRETLLRIEKDLHAFVSDHGRCVVRFPVMTSYGRMLVHRCAELFQLSHKLDSSARSTVLVSKNGTSGGCIPCTSFSQWCTATFPKSPQRKPEEETAAKSILRRAAGGTGGGGGAVSGARSLQQRERDYERVRRRIFSTDNSQDTEWPWLTSGPIKLLTPEPGRNKLIKVQSLESRGAAEAGPRNPVSKSHSLDGYGADPPQTRLLSRQGDLASSSWRLSPSSSGYKTLSLRSTDSVTPSPTGCASPEAVGTVAGAGAAAGSTPRAVVWAVTDLSAVPRGALVIHPQTGLPLTHSDGSIYHFDPANPPIVQDEILFIQNDHQQDADKRRGRLEKQDSFIDNECDCPSEGCEDKCCCECPGQEICTKCPVEQSTPIQSLPNSKPNSMPNSPGKRAEPNAGTMKKHSGPDPANQRSAYDTPRPIYENPNNQRPSYDVPANQRPPYDSPANQRPLYENTTNQKANAEATTNQCSPSRIRHNYNALQRYDPALQRYGNSRYDANQMQLSRYDPNQYAMDGSNSRSINEPANQRQAIDSTTNHRQSSDSTANNRQSDDANNQQLVPYEFANRQIESANQRQVVEVSASQRQAIDALANQRAYERQRYDMQRPPSYEQAIHRNDMQNQYMQSYGQYRTDEITSPPQMVGQYQDPGEMQQAMMAQKLTPVPIQDPNMRPMSLAANVMYPAVHQAYPYVNTCRLEQPMQQMQQMQQLQALQPVYQQMMRPLQQQNERGQLAASPHAETTAFRIDPSYPYATDYNAACGACTDPTMYQQHQRSISVGYGQMEIPQAVVPQTYPVHNVMPQIPPYPYQEAVQWPVGGGGKLVLPAETYPVLCPAIYPQYGVVYPQVQHVIPQTYPICPPVYPIVDKQPEVYQHRTNAYNHRQPKRNSTTTGSSRNTPQTPDEKKVQPDISRDTMTSREIPNRDAAVNHDVTTNRAVASRDVVKHDRNSDIAGRGDLADQEPVAGRDVASHDVAVTNEKTRPPKEVAMKIAQVQDRLAQSERENTRGHRGRDEWRRRNSGGGILGSYPVNNFNGRMMGRTLSEEAQINPALFNSIRNIQAKQNYQQQQDRRMYEFAQYRDGRYDNRYDNRYDTRYDTRYDSRYENRYDNRRRNDREERVAPQPQDARVRGAWRPTVPIMRPFIVRQMTPSNWTRRSPGVIAPVINHPRRQHPDRNPRR